MKRTHRSLYLRDRLSTSFVSREGAKAAKNDKNKKGHWFNSRLTKFFLASFAALREIALPGSGSSELGG